MGALRLLLALSVVLSHAGGIFGFQLAGGAFAVLIFFMVSGFLMQLVLTIRYDPIKDLMLFYGNRILRIFPLYWATLATALALSFWLSFHGVGYFALIGSHLESLGPCDAFILVFTQLALIGSDVLLFLNITPHGIGWSSGASDAPAMLLMVNPPAWSLGIELLFYALAPFLARRKVGWTVALFALSAAARMTLIGSHSLTGLTADRFFPTALPFFLAGMLACRWRTVITRHPTSSRIAGGGTILCVLSIGAVSVAGIRAGIPGQLFGLVFAGVAFVGIPALFAFSNSPLLPVWVRRLDAEMGALSYPTYIVHWQVITAFDAFLPETAMRSGLIVATVLCCAAILTRWVEKPIDRYRDRRRKRQPARVEISETRSSPANTGARVAIPKRQSTGASAAARGAGASKQRFPWTTRR